MATYKNQQKQTFYDRINRIESHHAEVVAVQSGPSRSFLAGKREKRKLPMMSFLIASVLSSGCLLAGNVLAFHLERIPPSARNQYEDAGALMGPFGLAGLFLGVLMIGFGMRDRPHILGILVGLMAMYLAEPYMAYAAPTVWADLYTPQHMENMLIRAGLLVPAAS